MISLVGLFSILKTLVFVIIGLLGIGFLIGIHELGHFLFCKLFNIKTPSFSIGMGPVIFKRKLGDTMFSLSLLPVGGYVEIAGHEEVGQGEQKHAKIKNKYSFAAKPYYQKLLVMCGGILVNFAFAYLAFSLLFILGLPKIPMLYPEEMPAKIGFIKPNSAASSSDLKINDTITKINSTKVNSAIELNNIIKKLPKTKIKITYITSSKNSNNSSSNQELYLTTDSVTSNNKTTGLLGIGFKELKTFKTLAPLSFVNSISQGIKTTNQLIYKTYASFKSLLEKRSIDGIGGPISVVSATFHGAQKGFKFFLILLAFISINLAVLNIIPIPIMDGGQILFVTLEAIFRRPIPEKIRIAIHYVCWITVWLLIAYISFVDIRRLIANILN